MNVKTISTIKIIVFYLISSFFVLNANDLEDFAKDYEGYESLSSPSQNYQGRQIFLNMRMNEDGGNNLVYISNSNFIYNGYLDWAAHYFTHNKDQNCVSFGRRFNTPLGIRNLSNLRIKFNCDILIQNINPKSVKNITRETFRRWGVA